MVPHTRSHEALVCQRGGMQRQYVVAINETCVPGQTESRASYPAGMSEFGTPGGSLLDTLVLG